MIGMPVVGTLYSMMKNQKLQMKWDLRQKNPNMPKGDTPEDKQIIQLRESAENVRKANMLMSLDGKLKAGEKLSSDELDYLRENCPELYKEAMEVAMEREQYRKALEKCKTKEDVERLNSNKMQSFLSQAKTISSNPNISLGKKQELLDKILRRTMGVKSEHVTFTKTPQYADLPREAEIEDGKAKKKAERAVEIEQDEELDKPHYPQEPESLDKPLDTDAGEPTTDKPSEPSDKPPEASHPKKRDNTQAAGAKPVSAAKGAVVAAKAASPAATYTAAATATHTPSTQAQPAKISLRA